MNNVRKKIGFIKNRIINLCGFPFYYFFKFFPRRNNLWVFGSGFGYADNSKYLFEEVVETHPEIDAVWITIKKNDARLLRNKGIKAYWKNSIRGFIILARAKVYIYTGRTNDIKYVTSGGAFKFCLWHGVLIKEIEFLISKGPLLKRYNHSLGSRIDFACCYQKPDLLLTTGMVGSVFLRKSMLLDEEHTILNIYPRCKLFIESKEKQLSYLKQCGGILFDLYNVVSNYRKTYIYMPTFRDAHPFYLNEAIADFSRLNHVLKTCDAYFILKVHPNSLKYIKGGQNFSNIYILRENIDIYPLLPFIDVLITDYSSIYFDYLYLRKEIILFPFDQIRYESEDRPFVVNYDKDIIGKRVYSFNELLDVVSMNIDCHLSSTEYDEMIEKYGSNNNIDLADYIMHKL